MIRRVCGIDYSLTCTGVGICVQSPRGVSMVASTVTSKGKRAATLVDRYERLRTLADDVLHHAGVADLVLIEGMTPGAKGGSPIDRYAGWWMVCAGLIRRGIPIVTIAPTSLKLAITGSGRADKAAVAVALSRLWPDLDITSSDVSDAVGLAHLGAVFLGWPVTTLERHKQVKAVWPQLDVRGEGGSDAA